jgi:hypothetical protein
VGSVAKGFTGPLGTDRTWDGSCFLKESRVFLLSESDSGSDVIRKRVRGFSVHSSMSWKLSNAKVKTSPSALISVIKDSAT